MEYEWRTVYDEAVRLFGAKPYPDTEAKILDAFRERPAQVQHLVGEVARGFQEGRIRSPWAFLATLAEKKPTEGPQRVVASDGDERTMRVVRAKQWIRTAGLHFSLWPEVEDELFGDRGQLRAFRDDPALAESLRDFWLEVRTRGIALEREEEERAKALREARARAKKAKKEAVKR